MCSWVNPFSFMDVVKRGLSLKMIFHSEQFKPEVRHLSDDDPLGQNVQSNQVTRLCLTTTYFHLEVKSMSNLMVWLRFTTCHQFRPTSTVTCRTLSRRHWQQPHRSPCCSCTTGMTPLSSRNMVTGSCKVSSSIWMVSMQKSSSPLKSRPRDKFLSSMCM